MRKLLLQHERAPGDVLVLSALVRDIHLAHPDKFQISVKTTAAELWRHNPHVIQPTEDAEPFRMNYSHAINRVGIRNKHFLQGFYEDFERQLGVHVPLLYPRPDYHLSDEEKTVPLVSGRYWLVISGGKSDFITKHWVYKRWQQVINLLRGMGIYCVQVGAIGKGGDVFHYHPRLENCLCLAGLTTLRDMARLIYHADGVLCPVTAAIHFAAALEKPCVVIAGGREEWWWEAYVPNIGNFGTEIREEVRVPHRFLHTLGKLDCCKRSGCWRNKVEPGESCCKDVLNVRGQAIPRCMDMITVEHVIEAVMSYYEDGTLPPISQPKTIVITGGKPHLLHPNEPIPDQPQSALLEALTWPTPQLLIKTAGIKAIQGIPE